MGLILGAALNITSIMRQEYELCENELGISHDFTSFWTS